MPIQSAPPLLALVPAARQLVALNKCSFVTCWDNQEVQITLVLDQQVMVIVCDYLNESSDQAMVVYLCGTTGTPDKRIVTGSGSERTQTRVEPAAHEAAKLCSTLNRYLQDVSLLPDIGSFC